MSHVFISYNKNSGDFIEDLKKNLEDKEFEVWIFEDFDNLPLADDWPKKVDQAIKDAFAILLIMTPQAKESENVIYEIGFALGAGKKVIPIMLEKTSLPARISLFDYLNFTVRKARPWDTLFTQLETEREKKLSADIATFVKQAIDALKSPIPDIRSKAVRDLAQTNHLTAKEALLKVLDNPDSELDVCIEVALTLLDVKGVPALIEAFRYSNEDISNRAKRALTTIGIPSVGYLLRALENESVRIRRKAAEVLGNIKDKVTVPGLLQALYDSDDLVCHNAALALGQIGFPSIVGLLKVLKDEKEEKVRKEAAFALGVTERFEAIQDLLKTLREDQVKAIRLEAAIALGRIGHTDALTGLRDSLLHDDEADVRLRAAISLAQIEHPDAIPWLLDALGDTDKEVRRNAILALGQIGNPAALPGLNEALLSVEEQDIRDSISQAIRNIERTKPGTTSGSTGNRLTNANGGY